MRIIILISVFVLGTFNSISQITAVVEKFDLPVALNESSGAIFFNDKLITHNDSGGENKLYELDTNSGFVTREVTILNVTNVDWEDITQDDANIYIGDIGNNVSGNRTDLKIYKISKSDYLSSEAVNAQVIAFSYSDQSDFTALTANTTEWDAEALVSFDATNLMVFTKNWVNGITKGYLVSKTPGIYSLTPLNTTLNSGGLITGGTFNPLSGKLYLVGYTNTLQPFVWVSENFIGNDIFSGTNTKTTLSSLGLEQTEAITFVSENQYFVTSEAYSIGPLAEKAKLISFSTNDVALSVNKVNSKRNIAFYPNPVSDFLYIQNEEMTSAEVYDMKLAKLYKGNTNYIDMSRFSEGIYMVKINFDNDFSLIKKIVKK
jgi:hypothetical protein